MGTNERGHGGVKSVCGKLLLLLSLLALLITLIPPIYPPTYLPTSSAPPLLGFLLLIVPFYSHTFTSCVVPTLFPSFAWKLTLLTRVSALLPNYIPHHLPPTIFSFSTLTWEMGGLNDSWVGSFFILKIFICDTKVVSWMHAFFS
jgi:hypothetical protein